MSLVDPFCGSGSTLEAGFRLGVKVLGIEREPVYAQTASVRMEALFRDKRVGDVAIKQHSNKQKLGEKE